MRGCVADPDDGTMSRTAREAALQAIRTRRETRVILISFKAGSTGLNLTCCNRVILCDLWWNPQIEEQAFDRAHRYVGWLTQARPGEKRVHLQAVDHRHGRGADSAATGEEACACQSGAGWQHAAVARYVTKPDAASRLSAKELNFLFGA